LEESHFLLGKWLRHSKDSWAIGVAEPVALRSGASLMFEEIVPGANINFLLRTSAEKKGSAYNKNRNIPYRELTQ
jgi:hypothetical protein